MARDATNRLGQQAARQRNGNGAQPGTQVASRERSALETRQDTIAGLIKRMGPEMAAALPKHLTPERMVRITTTVMRRTPALAQCDDASLLGAIMTCAQLGLEPGPTGQAYLVPYGKECTFILGYRGMIELARRSGLIETIYAHPVYERDEFEYELGLDEKLRHVPFTGDGDPGPMTYVYAVVKYKGGGHNVVVMSRAQVERIRLGSKSGNSPAWKQHYDAMACKTAVRRLARWMPQTVEFQTALAVDGKSRSSWQDPGGLDDVAAEGFIEGEVVTPDDPPARPTSGAPVNTQTGELPDGPLGDGQAAVPVGEPDDPWAGVDVAQPGGES